MVEARSLMTKKIITVKPDMPIQAAYEEMKEHGIRHLPVIDHTGKLVGMVSERDLLRASHVRMVNEIEQEMTFNPHHTVEDFMSWPVQTISEKTSILHVAKMMIDEKVSAFVVSGPNEYIKGILTTDDLLQYLVELMQTSENYGKVSIEKMFWHHP